MGWVCLCCGEDKKRPVWVQSGRAARARSGFVPPTHLVQADGELALSHDSVEEGEMAGFRIV